MTTPRKTRASAAVSSAKNVSEKPAETMEKKLEAPQRYRLKVFGIGGAGTNTLRHIASAREAGQHLLTGVDLIAIHTDSQALNMTNATEKIYHDLSVIQLGAAVVHGMGTGGDVELGARAAQQDNEQLAAEVRNVDVAFIIAGLGGGTGGGASPVLARLAKHQGALVLAFVTLPFGFEGEQRQQHALASLEQLKAHADAVICISNDRLFKIVSENASAVEAFARGNEALAGGAQAVWQLLSRRGLINLDFADLRATLGAKHLDGLFSHGVGSGSERAKDAVKMLLENPLLDTEALARAEGVLVSLLGGPELTLVDVQKAVEPISRIASRAHVIMGAATDGAMRDKLTVTLIAGVAPLVTHRASSPLAHKPVPAARVRPGEIYPARSGINPNRSARPDPASCDSGITPASSPVTSVKTSELAPQPKKEPVAPKQETLALENVSRGRFDKSEPTLYDGENLDVPTYLRRGVVLKR
jgi:cell division protein FtsZ